MGTIGRIDEYRLSDKNWSSYITRVKQFFKVNLVKPEMETAILITIVGSETFELMANLCSPKQPEDMKFKDIVELMQNHLEPTPSEIAERYTFRQRKQEPNEDIATYVATLKKLARFCGFKDTLDENLRDQLVFGLKSDTIRQRLFSEKQLTYAKAYHLAVSLEAAERNADLMKTPEAVMGKVQVNQQNRKAKWGQKSTVKVETRHACSCRHCGKSNHEEKSCFFKDAVCHSCKKGGHISSICKLKPKNNPKNGKKHFNKFLNVNTQLEEDCTFFNVVDKHVARYEAAKISLQVNNLKVFFEIDTGSGISAISDIFYQKHFSNFKKYEANLKLKSYNGLNIQTLGYILVDVSYDKITKKNLKCFIIKSGGPPLIGRDWLKELNISVDSYLNNIQCDFPHVDKLSEYLLSKFPNVFKNELGKFKAGEIKLYLKPDARPIFCKPRSLPFALKDKVEKELDKLVSMGVLTSVEFSDWATPIVPVLKKNGEIRICGDFKVTVNPKLNITKYPIPKIDDILASLKNCSMFSKIDLSQAYAQLELDEDSKKK